MKHLYYSILLIAIILVSCSDKYVIKGTSSQSMFDGTVAYIKHYNEDGYELIDSCKVVHGKFEMSGLVDSIMCVSLFMGEQNCIPIVLEYGNINIDFANSFIKIEGTPLNERLYKFLFTRDSLMLQLAELPTLRNTMILDGYDLMDVSREIERNESEIIRSVRQLEKNFVADNFDNVLGVTWFMQLCEDATMRSGYPTTTPMIEEILISAPEEFKQHPVISNFMQKVDEAMMGNMPDRKPVPPALLPKRQSPPSGVHNANY